jgi:hypothetical protein
VGQIPQGPKGDKGDKGETGALGISGYEIVQVAGITRSGSSSVSAAGASCPAGKRLLGGGGGVEVFEGADYTSLLLSSNQPISQTSWNVTVVRWKATPGTWRVLAYAICARVSG